MTKVYKPEWEEELIPDGEVVHPTEDKRQEQIAHHMESILSLLGYDLTNQHFARTPERVAQVLWEFRANGHPEDAAKWLEVSFDDPHNSLVIVGRINVTSMCAHHMLPVVGEAWVGYLPENKVTGLSKLARVTNHFAHQLTVQETVTQQIADAMEVHLDPRGVMVVIKATHGCMSLRGVQNTNALTTTSAVRGVFLDDPAARAEFLNLIKEGS